jgi:hypothetical protein
MSGIALNVKIGREVFKERRRLLWQKAGSSLTQGKVYIMLSN